MQDKTHDLIQTLRTAIAIWSEKMGHNDAYVRGSQARKDLAEQIVGYRAMLGRQGFIDRLRQGIRDHMSRAP